MAYCKLRDGCEREDSLNETLFYVGKYTNYTYYNIVATQQMVDANMNHTTQKMFPEIN